MILETRPLWQNNAITGSEFIVFILYGCLRTVKLNASICSGRLDWWVVNILIQHNTEGYRVINHGNEWDD